MNYKEFSGLMSWIAWHERLDSMGNTEEKARERRHYRDNTPSVTVGKALVQITLDNDQFTRYSVVKNAKMITALFERLKNRGILGHNDENQIVKRFWEL